MFAAAGHAKGECLVKTGNGLRLTKPFTSDVGKVSVRCAYVLLFEHVYGVQAKSVTSTFQKAKVITNWLINVLIIMVSAQLVSR